jgi:glutamate dehydrogenase
VAWPKARRPIAIFVSHAAVLTDNIDGDTCCRRAHVRHDGDDPYLVVAADKGTATFSDTANAIALEHGFWLGDAFASGGSAGYDHKKMGITARGAWEAVKRHFREMTSTSRRRRSPSPGSATCRATCSATACCCRARSSSSPPSTTATSSSIPTRTPRRPSPSGKRLFGLPRSSWQDYDKALISEGGGNVLAALKAIPLTPRVRAAPRPRQAAGDAGRGHLGDPEGAGRPSLVRRHRHLRARVGRDRDAEVGDRANDADPHPGVRDLRARVIGEGANLGVTQRGRIEAAARASASTPTPSTTPPASTRPTSR